LADDREDARGGAAGNTSKMDELAGTSAAFMTMASDDPWLRAGKNALIPGVLCADWGPQRDYAAFTAAAEAVTRQTPRFAWRFWDATPVATARPGSAIALGGLLRLAIRHTD
jgi:hypothetical protein